MPGIDFNVLRQEISIEVKQLKADGYEPILKGARWLLLGRQSTRARPFGTDRLWKLVTVIAGR